MFPSCSAAPRMLVRGEFIFISVSTTPAPEITHISGRSGQHPKLQQGNCKPFRLTEKLKPTKLYVCNLVLIPSPSVKIPCQWWSASCKGRRFNFTRLRLASGVTVYFFLRMLSHLTKHFLLKTTSPCSIMADTVAWALSQFNVADFCLRSCPKLTAHCSGRQGLHW